MDGMQNLLSGVINLLMGQGQQQQPQGQTQGPGTTGGQFPSAPTGQGQGVGMSPLVQSLLAGYFGAIGAPKLSGWGGALSRGGLTALDQYGRAEQMQQRDQLMQQQAAQEQQRMKLEQQQYDLSAQEAPSKLDLTRAQAEEARARAKKLQEEDTADKIWYIDPNDYTKRAHVKKDSPEAAQAEAQGMVDTDALKVLQAGAKPDASAAEKAKAAQVRVEADAQKEKMKAIREYNKFYADHPVAGLYSSPYKDEKGKTFKDAESYGEYVRQQYIKNQSTAMTQGVVPTRPPPAQPGFNPISAHAPDQSQNQSSSTVNDLINQYGGK